MRRDVADAGEAPLDRLDDAVGDRMRFARRRVGRDSQVKVEMRVVRALCLGFGGYNTMQMPIIMRPAHLLKACVVAIRMRLFIG